MSLFIEQAFADAAAGQPAGGSMWSLVMMVGFFAIFYFLLIRPQQKKAKEHKQMLSQLQKGDEVVTNGGIVGKITKVSDEFITLQVNDNTQLNFQKAAVVASLPKGTIKAI
ncbi:preprotein translocase subunit YajC [Zooshikella ganghwensis]|uniref:Sec translocon accessory complex subunit YajC n=1 Tax=Zooshikella ganghwensis TaxID=202772 RepID=A0A4P9VIB4_9GAMM|nr:preprotein translocase subunit YajC [Zooshikella ganghwensis]RDH42958.1 preprotein translocase subunit YajC [Zooshikella ganghwensis]